MSKFTLDLVDDGLGQAQLARDLQALTAIEKKVKQKEREQ